MLVYAELTGKHNNPACNRFLLSEPKLKQKIGIFYTDLLSFPLLKQKYSVAHTLQKMLLFFLSLEFNSIHIRKLFNVSVSYDCGIKLEIFSSL